MSLGKFDLEKVWNRVMPDTDTCTVCEEKLPSDQDSEVCGRITCADVLVGMLQHRLGMLPKHRTPLEALMDDPDLKKDVPEEYKRWVKESLNQ